jgi:hypothetical protein
MSAPGANSNHALLAPYNAPPVASTAAVAFRIRPRVFSGRSWPIAGSTFKFTCFLRETAGTCPRSLSWDVDGANVHGAWVWTLSRNFTGMPMSAGEWHAWPAAPKVETRGKAWQRDGCAALRNLKRPRVRQRRLPLAAGTHPRQSVRGNDGKSWGLDSEKTVPRNPRQPQPPAGALFAKERKANLECFGTFIAPPRANGVISVRVPTWHRTASRAELALATSSARLS